MSEEQIDVAKLCHAYMSQTWNKEKLASLLRFGRKQNGPWDDIAGDMPEDGDEQVLCAVPELLAEVVSLRKRVDELEAFLERVRDNYDCDQDGHKYGTECRSCEAKRLLARQLQSKGE